MAVSAQKRSAPAAKSKNVVAAARGKRAGRAPRTAGMWEQVKGILVTVAIFLLIRAFLVEAFRIPSGSMVPTLLVGDWLFVNKLVYGPHVPFTDVSLPGYAEPTRGEVVVFQSPPQDPSIRITPEDVTPTLVKRLVGVAGDTLHMRRGLLHVNGIAQRQGYGAVPAEPGAEFAPLPIFAWQASHAARGSRFGAAPGEPTVDDWGPIVVPPRHFFMLGDNRYNSVDSRFYGFVPRENVRGRPIFVYYSYDGEAGTPLAFLTDIRWGRIGHVIK